MTTAEQEPTWAPRTYDSISIASTEDPAGANEALAATTLAGQDPPTLVVRSVSPGGLDALLADES